MSGNSLSKKSPILMISRARGPATSRPGTTWIGWKRIGLIYCLKPSGCFWPWRDRKHSSLRVPRKPLPGPGPPTPRTVGRCSSTFAPRKDRVFMQIAGEWRDCADGTTRPMVRVNAVGADANLHEEFFLLDSGADRTVLSAFFLLRLNL